MAVVQAVKVRFLRRYCWEESWRPVRPLWKG
jgi:hypothetical protein